MKKIREKGVAAHPFLEETLNSDDVQNAIDTFMMQTGAVLSAEAWAGNQGVGGTSTFGAALGAAFNIP